MFVLHWYFPEILDSKKKTTYPHSLAPINRECPNDMYPKLKMYISAVILDSYGYTPVAYVTVHCVVLPWLN